MNMLFFIRKLFIFLRIKLRKNLKPSDLSRAFLNKKSIPLVAYTNGGLANSYRTVISASMVSDKFEVKVNGIDFHPVENIDFFVDELGLNKISKSVLPNYSSWIIPCINFYSDYRDAQCFNLLNRYGLYHDVCELALFPDYHRFILEKSKFDAIRAKYQINQDLSKTLGVQLRVWDEEPENSLLLLDRVYSDYKELNWRNLIFHTVVNNESLDLIADKIQSVYRQTDSMSVFLSCNKRDSHNQIKIILEQRGLVFCKVENTFELAPDVFDFIVLSNCRSILRSPGSTFGHLASIFRPDLSNDFII